MTMIKTGSELIEGTKITLNGVNYVFPTLGGKAYRVGGAFKKLELIQNEFNEAQKLSHQGGSMPALSTEAMDALYNLIFYSFQRNYPEVTEDWVDQQVDLETAMKLFPLVVSQQSDENRRRLNEVAKNAQK